MSKHLISPWVLIATFLLSSAFAAAAPAQTVSFIARRDFATGAGPTAVAVADFNGDDKLDLAVANQIASTASILLGNDDGSFQPAVDYATGPSPFSVAVSDFNGDGAADLAVANFRRGTVSILLGNGDGTFQTAIAVPAGTWPQSVAAGDFNRDGAADLAVADGSSNNVVVLLGNGDGTFQSAMTFGTGLTPFSVAVGDFNGDSVPDLAVANYVSYSVSVLLGVGDGSFGIAQDFHTGPHPFSVKVGDFNGDGSPDLVVVNLGDGVTQPLRGDVSVLLGNGTGSFEVIANYAANTSPKAVTIGDFNRDGHVDLVTGGLVLLGNGDGTFQTVVNQATSNDHSTLVTGDFNRDGLMDFVVTNGQAYTVSVVIGNGDGTFLATPTFATDPRPLFVAVGDFNGDRVPDLAVANETLTGSVSVLLGNRNGTFQPPQNFATGGPSGSQPKAVAAGDFNGDSRPDLVVVNDNVGDCSVSVLLGNGDGTFQTPANYPVGSGPSSVAVGDFNHDGRVDLVVPNARSNNVSVFAGNGDGTFQPARYFPAGNGERNVAVGDLDGDGNLDFAIAESGSGDVLVGFGNGDFTFQFRAYGAGQTPLSVGVADLDGDGALDLAVTNDWFEPGLTVRLNNGGQNFQLPQAFRAGAFGASSVTVGDFNGDGIPDLASANSHTNDVSVLLGNGDGSFLPALTFGVGSQPLSIAVDDFNEDHKLDLVVINYSSNTVSVLINNTPTYELTVTRPGNGIGTVTSTSIPASAKQIDCGTECTAPYYGGTQVILTAYADLGSTFAGWSGCDEVSEATCTVTMSQAKSAAATFTLQRFALTVTKNGIGRGTVTSRSNPASSTQIKCGTTCSVDYDWNTVVMLTPTPAFANRFMGWSGCDSESGSTCFVTMRSETSVTARFVGLPLELETSANPAGELKKHN